MNVLISGGCKNGKSYFAQRLAKQMAENCRAEPLKLYYLATMEPVDEEDRARIQRHRKERQGWGFTTLERSRDICACLSDERCATGGGACANAADRGGVFLLDSVTALLASEMFGRDGSVDAGAPERVAADLLRFAESTGNTVFVSDSIYADAIFYDDLTEAYRRGLALADRALARVCDQVAEVCYGGVNWFKMQDL